MTTTRVIGLKAITTNAELCDFVEVPTLAETCPTEVDGKYLLARLYSDKPNMNWCRALDQNLIIRVVSQNHGMTDGTDGALPVGLPTPEDLFNMVWRLVPDFVKSKITKWAKAKMDGPIANEITGYVKQALALLPIPIPAFFVNAVANLVIPPLVTYITHILGSSESTTIPAIASLTFSHRTAMHLNVMKNFDRRILLAAGLKPDQLPAHLQFSNDAGDENFVPLGQPDERDCHTNMAQFYDAEFPNGSKPLQLLEIIAAQIRTNPKSDPGVDDFGLAVWKSLNSDTKTKLRNYAKEHPPNKAAIADMLWTPIRTILQQNPYNVPGPILDSFTSMKTPEVTEYVVTLEG